jgi:5'-nucleotidase / UDP-sugar diphosphatase
VNTVNRRSALIAILSALALLFVGFAPVAAAPSDHVLKLTILHMNDPHGHYAPYKSGNYSGLIGGFAKAEAVMADVATKDKAEGRHTLILMAGDLLTGTPFSMVFKGTLGVELMNKMKFDAMVVGNHEFDYGQDNLLNNLKPIMKFPLLSANIRTTGGKHPFESIFEKKFPGTDTKIEIFGLTTQETPITTHPKNVKGLVFDDPIATAKGILKHVGPKDLVIALTHLGIQEDKKLAAACPRINVIIGGHSHTELLEPVKVGNTIIGQAGAYAKYVGRIDLDVKDGKIKKYSGGLILLDDKIKEDPEIAAIIENHQQQMSSNLQKVIGKSDVVLQGNEWAVRSGKTTNLGRLIAYLLASSAGTKAAVMNGGGIRESIKQGDVTLGDVYTVLPFSNTVVKMDLIGADLLAALQRSADLPKGNGGKLQTYGIDYSVKGGKVRIRRIACKPFEPEKTYSVATNDFLMAGGDGYSIFKNKGKNSYDTGKQVADLLIDFIKDERVITQKALDEIK